MHALKFEKFWEDSSTDVDDDDDNDDGATIF
jgi:hypothetical protein